MFNVLHALVRMLRRKEVAPPSVHAAARMKKIRTKNMADGSRKAREILAAENV